MKALFAFLLPFVLLSSAAMAENLLTIKYAYYPSPAHNAALYAMKNGLVESDTIEVEIIPLDISALMQATAVGTYDVVEGSATSLPVAKHRGLPIEMIGVTQRPYLTTPNGQYWVRKDSDAKTLSDLKGKRIGIPTFTGAGMAWLRLGTRALGFNDDPKTGDFQFIEVPPSTLPTALASGNLDAARLEHNQVYLAETSGEFRPVGNAYAALKEKFNVRGIGPVLIAYSDRLKANPEAHKEFLRLFRASVDYMMNNQDEVFGVVSVEEKIDKDYFTFSYANIFTMAVLLNEGDLRAIELLWKESAAMGFFDAPVPPIREVLWSEAPIEKGDGQW